LNVMTADGDESDGGSGLPDIVGAATKVAETSVMKDLFGRSFRAVGDYYGEQIEEYYKKKKEKRLKNVRDHELRVAQVIGEPVNILSKPERGRAIERWVDVAADVPLEDEERAAVLEAVLAQIFSSDVTIDFLDVSERLSSSGMRVLLNAPFDKDVAPKGDDRQTFERLRALGLARTLDLGHAVAVIFAWLVGTTVGLFILFVVIPRYLPRLLAIEFVVEAVLTSAVVLVLGLALLSTKYRLTEFGRLLQRSALRFYRDQTSLRKIRILSAIPGKPLIWGMLAVILACALPLALESYLPAQLRTDFRPTIIISSPPSLGGPSAPAPPAPAPPLVPEPPKPTTLTAGEIEKLKDAWNSVNNQMEGIQGLTTESQELVKDWPQRIKVNPQAVGSQLLQMRDAINQHRVSLQSLKNSYEKYPNIAPVLEEATKGGSFTRLYTSFDNLAREAQKLQPHPENFEIIIKPYANDLKDALDEMTKWANATRNFAKQQSDELSKIDLR
jgi:hypothetical protein